MMTLKNKLGKTLVTTGMTTALLLVGTIIPAHALTTWTSGVNCGIGKTLVVASYAPIGGNTVHYANGYEIGRYTGKKPFSSVSKNRSGNVTATATTTFSFRSVSARSYCPKGKLCGE